MVRPRASVLLIDESADDSLEVLDCEGVWYVVYEQRAVSLVKKTWGSRGQTVKYPRTGFNNPAHAYNLARKLNQRFNTDLFTVIEIK